MAPATFVTSLLAPTTANVAATPIPHPTSNFEYVGCVSASLASFPKHMPFGTTFSPEECLEACIGQAHLVAIGGGCYCDDPEDATPVSFELVDEAECSVVCVPGDDDARCGGEDGVFSLWQLPGTEKADCKNKVEVKVAHECAPEVTDCPGRAKFAAAPEETAPQEAPPQETVPPIIPTAACPPEGCGEPIPATPEPQNQQPAANHCPPEGCPPATPVPAPVVATPAPVNNSTPSACPPEGCVIPPAAENPAAVLPECQGEDCDADGQDEAAAGSSDEVTGAAGEQSDAAGDASGEQSGASSEESGASGEESGAAGDAPALVSESPRLYTSGVLSALVAVIFGLCLM